VTDHDAEIKARRELLSAAAKRATDTQPDQIRLIAAPQHAWSDASAVEAYAKPLRALGFTEAGAYTVDVLPVAIRFLLDGPGRMYAAIYEHAKAGVWLNLIALYEDGTSSTFTTTRDRGLEKRPGHPITYCTGASADQLHATLRRQLAASPAPRSLSASAIVREFEQAWADGIHWRKSRGVSIAEVASVMISRDGRPARVLRPERIQFIGAQDGEPERELAASLGAVFEEQGTVGKAYLVRVRYDDTAETSVALCLASATPTDARLLGEIRKVFANLFTSESHLDLLFVSSGDVARLERAAAPFYTRTLHS